MTEQFWPHQGFNIRIKAISKVALIGSFRLRFIEKRHTGLNIFSEVLNLSRKEKKMEPESRCFGLGVAKWYFVLSLYKALGSAASIKTNSNYQFSGERMLCVFSTLCNARAT